MSGQNECYAEADGKRAAVDLATARPEELTHKCWSIDNRLSQASSEYNRQFISAMNNELENRNLLPKVALNFVAQTDVPCLEQLANKHKHAEMSDLVQAEDDLKRQGRTVESNIVHGLVTHQDDIKDAHAERNFWGKNHGGIDAKRLGDWGEKNRPDFYGAMDDTKDRSQNRAHFTPGIIDDTRHGHRQERENDSPPTNHDRKQDAEIKRLSDELAREKKAHQDLEKANQLKEKTEAGVIKDAHHTVKHGETLYDMACLALHNAGRVHMTPAAIRFEEEKIRALNHLAPHEQLHSGQSLMLRTDEEVSRETARRMKNAERAKSEESESVQPVRHETQWGESHPRYRRPNTESTIPRPEWQLPEPGYINMNRGY